MRATLVWLFMASAAPALTLYQVGNSFTQDSQPQWIDDFGAANGVAIDNGFHILCGASLHTIASNASSTCVPSNAHGTFGVALTQEQWDHVAFQSHRDGATSLHLESQAALFLASLAEESAMTQHWLYQAWPFRDGDMTSDQWPDPYSESLGVLHRRAYFDQLMQTIRQHDPTVKMIPAGEVIYVLGVQFDLGLIPGFTSRDELYRDGLHLSAIGAIAAGASVVSSVTGIPAGDLTLSPGIYYQHLYTPEQIDAVLDVVEAVIEASPWAVAEGDFNRDGVVDAQDYVVWRDDQATHHLTGGYHAFSGRYTGDLDPWPPVVPSIPSPATWGLFAAGAAALASRRQSVN